MMKESQARRVLKLMSPVKYLSRNKSTASKEDLDLFESKDPVEYIDYLDNEADGHDENINRMNHNAEEMLQNGFREIGEQSRIAQGETPTKLPNKTFGVKPNAITDCDRQKSIEEIMKMINVPYAEKSEKDARRGKDIDMNIGRRLAAKDKLDIMTGNSPIKGDYDQFTSPKKVMIVPDNNIFRKALTISAKSPFKKKNPVTKQNESLVSNPSSDIVKLEGPLRTSEVDPSAHQATIPSAFELLIHARICALLEGYDTLLETRAKAGKRWFSFGDLVGISREELESMYVSSIGQKSQSSLCIKREKGFLPVTGFLHSSPPSLGNPFENLVLNCINSTKSYSSLSSEEEQNKSNNRRIPIKSRAMKPHPSTIRSLLECTDDLVVQGYFNETIGNEVEEIESASVQVSIFSSQKQRQFIVCYRGSIAQHAKPVRSKSCYNIDPNGINDEFQRSYVLDLEKKVFDTIKHLTSSNPFCDVIFTGHSFGGVLALIAAVRCAEHQQDLTVSFHGFGIPKVGQESFRFRAHSLPNLRIIRVEHAADYYVDLPTGSWEHIGHTIVIDYSKDKKRTMVNPMSNQSELVLAYATAYKFGKKCHANNMNLRGRHVIDSRGKKTQGKADHEMRNYLHAIEHFTHMGSQWVSSFANEFGSGIVMRNNETRSLV